MPELVGAEPVPREAAFAGAGQRRELTARSGVGERGEDQRREPVARPEGQRRDHAAPEPLGWSTGASARGSAGPSTVSARRTHSTRVPAMRSCSARLS